MKKTTNQSYVFYITVLFIIFLTSDVYSYQYSIEFDNSGTMGHDNTYHWHNTFRYDGQNFDMKGDEWDFEDWVLPFKVNSYGNGSNEKVNVKVSFDLVSYTRINYSSNVDLTNSSLPVTYSALVYDYSNWNNVLNFNQTGQINYNEPSSERIATILRLDTNTWYSPIFYARVDGSHEIDFQVVDPTQRWAYEIEWVGQFDNIQFDIVSVPEPSSLLILGFGLVVLSLCRRSTASVILKVIGCEA